MKPLRVSLSEMYDRIWCQTQVHGGIKGIFLQQKKLNVSTKCLRLTQLLIVSLMKYGI